MTTEHGFIDLTAVERRFLDVRLRRLRALDFRDGSQSGRVSDERDVAGDESAVHGVVEGASDDEVDLIHGLRRERASAVGRMQQAVVEGFEVVRPEAP